MQLNSKQLSVTVPSALFEPVFYVFDFTMQPALTKFLIVDETKLNQIPFLDIRFEPFAHGSFTLPTDALFNLESQHKLRRPKPHFIFHHAFVCSTLLSRCLNQIDAFISLKEPWIYRRLSDLKRSHGNQLNDQQWRALFSNYSALLCKNYISGKTPIIKMTNIANNLLTDVRQYLPESKILYLYSDLKSFLISNLKKTKETQEKMPTLLRDFIHDENFANQFPEWGNQNGISFLQTCALIWIVSLYNFQQTAGKSNHNIATLSMSDFLDNMPLALGALSKFFGHRCTENDVKRMVDSEVTSTNAKDQGQKFTQETRNSETSAILDTHGKRIEETITWLEPLLEKINSYQFLEENALLGKNQ